jgi:hypothetical protein
MAKSKAKPYINPASPVTWLTSPRPHEEAAEEEYQRWLAWIAGRGIDPSDA